MFKVITILFSCLLLTHGQGTKGGYEGAASIQQQQQKDFPSEEGALSPESLPYLAPPPAPAPEPVGAGPNLDELYGPPKPYSFGYDAPGSDGRSSRSESSDGRKVTGSYTLVGADGINRVVHYVADGDGFRASIITNEPGTERQNPSGVIMETSQPKAEEIARALGPVAEPGPGDAKQYIGAPIPAMPQISNYQTRPQYQAQPTFHFQPQFQSQPQFQPQPQFQSQPQPRPQPQPQRPSEGSAGPAFDQVRQEQEKFDQQPFDSQPQRFEQQKQQQQPQRFEQQQPQRFEQQPQRFEQQQQQIAQPAQLQPQAQYPLPAPIRPIIAPQPQRVQIRQEYIPHVVQEIPRIVPLAQPQYVQQPFIAQPLPPAQPIPAPRPVILAPAPVQLPAPTFSFQQPAQQQQATKSLPSAPVKSASAPVKGRLRSPSRFIAPVRLAPLPVPQPQPQPQASFFATQGKVSLPSQPQPSKTASKTSGQRVLKPFYLPVKTPTTTLAPQRFEQIRNEPYEPQSAVAGPAFSQVKLEQQKDAESQDQVNQQHQDQYFKS